MKTLVRKSSTQSQVGGAALEYVIVSAFAAILSVVAISFVAKVAKEKMDLMKNKLGTEVDIDYSSLESFDFNDR